MTAPQTTVQTLEEELTGSALFNTCRKALGHLLKFTQRNIPYRLGLTG